MKNEVKENKSIEGLLNPIKANWEGCIKINCHLLPKCTKKKVEQVKTECYKGSKTPFSLNNSGILSNLTPVWYKNAIIQHTFGLSTPTLKANYLVLSCHYEEPDDLSTVENEIGRVLLTSSSDSGITYGVTEGTFGLSDAITGNYNITAVASKKLFTLDSITGLHVGDLIKVKLSDYDNQEIEAKVKTLPVSGTQIEIFTELPVLPVIGDDVYQYLGRVYLVANGTTLPDSGNPISIAKYRERKSNADTIQIRHQIGFN